jgi:uncharacterized membrane protein YdjX (TVP38/TMEM64 family)
MSGGNITPPEPIPEEVSPLDLDQVAQNTSRKLLILLAAGIALFSVIHMTPLGEQVHSWDRLAELFKTGGVKAELSFVLISSFLIMVGTPRLLFWGVAGFTFGFWQGLFLSLFSSLVGSFLGFRAARWGGRAWLIERFGKNRFFGRIVRAEPTVASVALIRFLPVSNAIINVGLALGNVSSRTFLVGSLIGFLPQGIVVLIIGSGIAEDVPWAEAAQFGTASVLLLGVFFYTSLHRRKKR